MPTDRKLMQKALNALKDGDLTKVKQAIEALSARLAQPEPKPVAWWHDMGEVVDLNVSGRGVPLYTAPPRREWQGLTEQDVSQIRAEWETRDYKLSELCRAIEAKLKEKNNAS